MKIKQLVLSGVISSVLLFSCKKENTSNLDCSADKVQYDNYMPLKIGNYWIYQLNEIDSVGNIVSTGTRIDTITISGKETVNGKEYFKAESALQKRFPGISRLGLNLSDLLRVSEGRIVCPGKDSLGNDQEFVMFDLTTDSLTKLTCDNSFLFYPNCELKYARYNLPSEINIMTPAGNFNTRVVQQLQRLETGWDFWGIDRLLNKHYAKGIGLIRTEFFYFSSTGTQYWELIDYDLK